ncbi:hypothetical protein, partial [Agrococcus sp. HG114]|uniref:hypothetical protein n=1 Tax=Agrococcus sp. HG114 TaxID=2969757 RepID=UPI00215AA043
GALAAVDAPQGAAIALLGDDRSLVADARASGAFLVAVLHEQAPADVVALLLAEQARLVAGS